MQQSKEERIKEKHPELTEAQIEDIVAWMFSSGETLDDAINTIIGRETI